MIEIVNGKGTFVFDISLTRHRESPSLNDDIISGRTMEDFIVVDWTDLQSIDPVIDLANHLEKILKD